MHVCSRLIRFGLKILNKPVVHREIRCVMIRSVQNEILHILYTMKKLTLIPLFLLIFNLLNAQPNGDCASAMEICKKKNYSIRETGGEGRDRKEADFIACFMNGTNYGQAEENCTWIKFEIEKAGTLAFTITPEKEDNDIDFVVFKLPPTGDCSYKQIVRCMAAGSSQYDFITSTCMGKTGLRSSETDTSEDAGCSDQGDNTWLAPLKVEKGEKYVILISNVTEPGPGFDISFTGTCKLPCDDEKEKPAVAAAKLKEKEKPKPADKPIVTTKPKPSKPDTIGGREVEVSEVVKVKTRTIKVKIWDSQIEDGDIISIYIDDKKVVDKLYLRIKPTEYTFELPPGNEHYLTVYADNFGKSEPNTATVIIFDGTKEQVIDLVAGRKKQESVKIITE